MRVTGGRYAGRQLIVPKGPRIRPTQDQVRQALFNILGDRVEGARVLDLFSGSGALGIEALSRGAAHVTFVDRSGFSIRAIEANLRALVRTAGGGQVSLIRADAVTTIQKLAKQEAIFDLIFMDPPYSLDLARKTLMELSRCAIVSKVGWVVAEHNKRDPLPENLEGNNARLATQRVEIYGDTALTFYQRQ